MKHDSQFPALLSPGRIGTLYLRNRIIMSPMGTNLGSNDGFVTEQMKRYYEARAKGGVGLIVVGVASVDYPKGAAMVGQLALSDDKFLPGLSELAAIVHQHGAKIALQLQHAGKLATTDLKQGRVPVCASDVSIPLEAVLKDLTLTEIMKIAAGFTEIPEGGPKARALTVEEIADLVQRFAEAAERAQKADFDGVEIHAAHGYLLAQFLSRSTNFRDDRYGGSLPNRSRLLKEVLHAVRQRIGADYPMWCRLDAREFRTENGITIEDAQQTALVAARAGVDALHISAYGGAAGIGPSEAPFVHVPGSLLPYAEAIKRLTTTPVIAVGRISPELGEQAIRGGQADFIAMARQLLADPDLPQKLAQGRRKDIRPCIACYMCGSQIYVNEKVTCAVNPAVGREAEFQPKPAPHPKRVLVIGGGPAGLQTAITATQRGHHVVLFEKERRLGGTMVVAALPWKPNQDLVDYLKHQIEQLPIEVRLNEEANILSVKEQDPDTIVLAVGGKRTLPQIPGAEGRRVMTGDDLREIFTGRPKADAAQKLPLLNRVLMYLGSPLLGQLYQPEIIREMTKHVLPLGGKKVVILGGELVGCELADFLSDRGRQVTILEQGDTFASEMSIVRRGRVLHELREKGVTLHAGVTVRRIKDPIVIFADKQGTEHEISADTILIATGVEPNLSLHKDIQRRNYETHTVGDCAELRLVQGSIADGFRVGLSL